MKQVITYIEQRFFPSLRADLTSNGGTSIPLDPKTVGTMLIACVLLTLFHYYGRTSFYLNTLEPFLLDRFNLADWSYRALLPYGYWAFASLIIRIALPLACILWLFKDSPRDYGFRRWEKGHGHIYVWMFVAIMPVLIAVSFTESFQGKYPFYAQASESLDHFVLYQITYGIQFISLEAFFRGFLVFALYKRLGFYGIVIMTIPYCMIHFGKPAAETFGSIFAGLLLGYLAIYSKSWIPGALLHWAVGISMDALCILQRIM